MLALQASGASWPAAEMESMVGLWTTLNWARMVVGAAGWLCALRALSPSRVGGGVAGLPTPGRNRWMKERITASRDLQLKLRLPTSTPWKGPL